ncbi:MAG: FAD-binding protein [Marmoricola sp.]|nr:FAD-binding protein [Marmoricola sp.]
MSLTRRNLLVLGAGAVVAGGCSKAPAPAPSTPTTSPAAPVTPAATRTATSSPVSRGVPWADLRRHVGGTLLQSGPAYDAARLTENPRYDNARPLAVLTASGPADVATALAFAQDHAVPLSIRSGGHSYPGWSAGGAAGTGVPRSLVLDLRRLEDVTWSGTSATIGTGAALAPVYAALAGRGRAIAGGSCATVGLGGLTLGGGVGVLTRALGLTCDAVTAMQVVTADGHLRSVTASQDPDLFWALRGGGGGHLGVVTSFTFSTTAAPALHTFYASWPIQAAAQVIHAWQSWAPSADARLWSTLKVLGGASHPSGPRILLSGTWTGSGSALPGQLAGLFGQVPPPSARSTASRTYGQAMASYAGCANIPTSRCHTGPGGALDREAFGATSHVAYAPLSPAGISTVLDQVHRATGSGLKEAGLSMDALGGRVRDLGPGDTAFVHRLALMTVQYTATFVGARAAAGDSFVRGFRSAMTPYWGNHAYVNYADPTLPDYRSAYFGANAARLAAVKKTYDPHGFFAQPQGY